MFTRIRKRQTWRPQRRLPIKDIIETTVRARIGSGYNYKTGAVKRVTDKLVERYWLGWYPSEKRFIDAAEVFLKEEEF